MADSAVTDAWQQAREAFRQAAGWYAEVLGQVGDRWGLPGLGEWDVRALAGHTSRSLLTVEAYLARPAPEVEIASALDYYRATRAISAGPEVAQRGRDAGQALGEDPVAAVGTIAARVLPLVERASGQELVTTIAGGMRLADYLPTRILELVVHTADLASALGLPAEPPALPAAVTLRLVSDLAVADRRAGALLLVATGRAVPPGFSVL